MIETIETIYEAVEGLYMYIATTIGSLSPLAIVATFGGMVLGCYLFAKLMDYLESR